VRLAGAAVARFSRSSQRELQSTVSPARHLRGRHVRSTVYRASAEIASLGLRSDVTSIRAGVLATARWQRKTLVKPRARAPAAAPVRQRSTGPPRRVAEAKLDPVRLGRR